MRKITKRKNKLKLIFLVILSIIIIGIVAYFFGSKLFINKSTMDTTYKIGILSGLDFFADTTNGFKVGMTKLGYKEGKDISYDVQESVVDITSYKSILTNFIDKNYDLIFVFPTEAALTAKELTKGKNIPVLFANASTDGVDLVTNLNNPEGNITGVRRLDQDMTVRRFNIMRKLVPKAKKMLVPYLRGYPIVPGELEKLYLASKNIGIRFIEMPADNPTELMNNLQKHIQLSGIDFDAVLLIPQPLGDSPEVVMVINKILGNNKIPIGGTYLKTADSNTLFGINVDNVVAGGQAASLANKILKGVPVSAISIVPAKIFFQLDLKEAQKLGLTVDENIISQADEVIK